MMSFANFLGGARFNNTGGSTISIVAGTERVRSFEFSTHKHIQMPNGMQLSIGAPVVYILNVGSNTLDIVDYNGNPLHTLAAGKGLVCCLVSATESENGVWSFCEYNVYT